jgi:ankyrin repeat protein
MEFTPLILACAQGNEENVKAVLSLNKASVNTHAKDGHTALYAASMNGHEAVVRLLLSQRGHR